MSISPKGSGFGVDEITTTAASAAPANLPNGRPSAGPMPDGTDADHNGRDVDASTGAEQDDESGPCGRDAARADDNLPQRVIQYYQRQHAAGAADDAILASILTNLRAGPVEEIRQALFRIACALLTACGYGRKTVAAAICLLDPGIDGTKLVAEVRQWMEKREAKYREEIGDEEFWANAFTPKRRRGRPPNEEI